MPYYTSRLCGDRATLVGESSDNLSMLNVYKRCSKAEWGWSVCNNGQSLGDLDLRESIKIMFQNSKHAHASIESITLD